MRDKNDSVLEGVRLPGAFAPTAMGDLARWRAAKRHDASYVRLGDAPSDRRGEKRRGARLRWGKALDESDRFLCECVIVNRTHGGASLRLTRNVAAPLKFQLYDDDSGAIFAAQVVWRRGGEIGCRIALEPTPGKARVAQRMRAAYYALA